MEFLITNFAPIMFAGLFAFLLLGFPVAFSLGACGLFFGLIGIELGVYGVPETFVIDREGVIRYKHIGAVTPEALRDVILPLLGKLGG